MELKIDAAIFKQYFDLKEKQFEAQMELSRETLRGINRIGEELITIAKKQVELDTEFRKLQLAREQIELPVKEANAKYEIARLEKKLADLSKPESKPEE